MCAEGRHSSSFNDATTEQRVWFCRLLKLISVCSGPKEVCCKRCCSDSCRILSMLIRSGASWGQCYSSPTIQLAFVPERLRADLLICPLLAARGAVPTLALCCSRSGSVSAAMECALLPCAVRGVLMDELGIDKATIHGTHRQPFPRSSVALHSFGLSHRQDPLPRGRNAYKDSTSPPHPAFLYHIFTSSHLPTN